jgi:urease beta subunit
VTALPPGCILHGDGDLVLNEGRDVLELRVVNTGDRAIQVGSHYHFYEVNSALLFDRPGTMRMRLDIPSGTSVRFEAGQEHRVRLVPYGGHRRVRGFRGLAAPEESAAAMSDAKGAQPR